MDFGFFRRVYRLGFRSLSAIGSSLTLTLHPGSGQPEAGGRRKVECEIAAVAYGETARSLAGLPTGSAIRCAGFLARRWRTGITLALHIDRYEPLDQRNTN